jgi:hypothetical protein
MKSAHELAMMWAPASATQSVLTLAIPWEVTLSVARWVPTLAILLVTMSELRSV